MEVFQLIVHIHWEIICTMYFSASLKHSFPSHSCIVLEIYLELISDRNFLLTLDYLFHAMHVFIGDMQFQCSGTF